MHHVSDLGGRTIAVREYLDATNYYTTSYAYDETANLLNAPNALNQVTSHQYDTLNRLTKTTYPDATTYEAYTYDEVGNLKTRRDRAGQVTTFNYDNRYRLTGIDYPGTNSDVSYAYDLNDNPTSITTDSPSPATTVTHAYDGLDRVL